MSSREEGISNADFTRLRDLIYAKAGINLSSDKKTMLELRIKRRVRSLDLNSFAEYCDYLFGHQGQKDELVHFIDVVTTNKTDFFREPGHFDFLVKKALPDLLARDGSARDVLVWSAGCSTGEEPYTLAIVLTEYGLTHPGFHFRILATDISTTVLEKAHLGVFSADVVQPVASDLRRKYFLRGRDPSSNRVRVVPELRKLVEFRRINFMDSDLGLSERADVIFCRNVIIYFDRPTQDRFCRSWRDTLFWAGTPLSGTPRLCMTWTCRSNRSPLRLIGKWMLNIEAALPEVYLQPGESHLARTPTIIRTILGSCVGVTFWSARLGVGALCHAQLPNCPKSSSGLTIAEGRRYVDFAIRDLARQFDDLRVRRTEVQVKLFGGGDVLLVSEAASLKPSVGKMNCETAFAVLRAEGFEVAASSVGGVAGLNIRFHTGTGEVLLRRLT